MKPLELSNVLIFALALIVIVPFAPNQTLSQPLLQNQALPGCNSTCGDIQIPYPFGIGYSSTLQHQPCFLESNFSLVCTNSTLKWGEDSNIIIQTLNVPTHQMDVMFWVARFCNDTQHDTTPWITMSSFTISTKQNKFITVGCNSMGTLNSFYDNDNKSTAYSTGCVTRCGNINDLNITYDGTCSGIGCCHVDIPPAMRNISIEASYYPNIAPDLGDCSYSFVAKDEFYKFSRNDIGNLPFDSVPMVLDWSVREQKCEDSKSRVDYACKENSYCDDTDTDFGYRCRCNDGYEGNPYLGCTDIDECKTWNHTCISEKNCVNTIGSHKCFCPEGKSGNGTKGVGCYQKDVATKVVIGVGAPIFVLFVGATLLYLIYQRRKLIKLREKYFQQNGGSILLQLLSRRENSSQGTQIFTEEELKKATNNFDDNLIIGSGGFGTVFKGILADTRIVAIKKSKIVDESQKEQFINEVIVLSQINHRNVVKLLGCCLEREVPLLVYEFVNNGTLFDFLHTEKMVNNETWKTRLRIAAEAAGALSYLHSAASIPIIHRDVKTANILLDDTYTAKVSDFGASRLVPLDQTEIATMVQGTFGYLDPEYMLTSQLTEKSDIYSFGVVLVELLTGEKPHSFGRPEEKRSLASHFLSCLKEDRLFDVLQVGILNEENKQEIMEVAILAARCLRLNGDERPSMKEVAMELEGMRLMEKHPGINTDQNLEEAHYLLNEASSSIYEPGDSSTHQYAGYDSIRDHVLIALDDGR